MTETGETPDVIAELAMLRARAELLEVALREARTAATDNIAQSELQLEAVKNGIIDLDCIKLLNTSDMLKDEKGSLKNASGEIAKLRRNKPWLFNGASSSAHAVAPISVPPKAKRATDMTLLEWREARYNLVHGK